MMTGWGECKNLLIIRADNMGDLIMSSPAIRALKETLKSRITLLASAVAAEAAKLIREIDEVIVAELPWVKKDLSMMPGELVTLAAKLKNYRFDGCIIFTVYSQSSLPAALLAWMAEIPRRLAFCRENPYALINSWIPEKEPYTFIRHQVKRDLALVQFIGATPEEDRIMLNCPAWADESMRRKLADTALRPDAPFVIFHAGVSEPKRTFPEESWIQLIRQAGQQFGLPVCLTGSQQDIPLIEKLKRHGGDRVIPVAGLLTVPELAALIKKASILVSVNTGPVHIAAGLQTPVIVLYAMTNPQHTPWKVPGRVFEFSVSPHLQSRNEVIRYVNDLIYDQQHSVPEINDILSAMGAVIRHTVDQA